MQHLDAVLAVVTLFGLTLLLAAGCAGHRLTPSAERPEMGVHPVTHYERWSGEDEAIDQETFWQALASLYLFTRWDRNGDRELDRYEFTQRVFAVWDDNADGFIVPREWAGARRAWYDGSSVEFAVWDVNRDRRLSVAEATTGMRQTNLFEHWDHNGDEEIVRREFFHYAFAVWDRDDSGTIEEREWTETLQAWRSTPHRRVAESN